MRDLLKKAFVTAICLVPIATVSAKSLVAPVSHEDLTNSEDHAVAVSQDTFKKIEGLDYSNTTNYKLDLDGTENASIALIENNKAEINAEVTSGSETESGITAKDSSKLFTLDITDPVSIKGYTIYQGNGILSTYVLTKSGDIYSAELPLKEKYEDSDKPTVTQMPFGNVQGIAIPDAPLREELLMVDTNDLDTIFMKGQDNRYFFIRGEDYGEVVVSQDLVSDAATGTTVENPKTGISDYIYLIIIAIVALGGAFGISKKIKKI